MVFTTVLNFVSHVRFWFVFVCLREYYKNVGATSTYFSENAVNTVPPPSNVVSHMTGPEQ